MRRNSIIFRKFTLRGITVAARVKVRNRREQQLVLILRVILALVQEAGLMVKGLVEKVL